ncbi:MAG: hypothetical protein ABIP94_00630 [Planctomycetota bacterium]
MVSLLIAVVVMAIVFDYINGFHDAANAVATVMSTGLLPIRTAVLWQRCSTSLARWLGPPSPRRLLRALRPPPT